MQLDVARSINVHLSLRRGQRRRSLHRRPLLSPAAGSADVRGARPGVLTAIGLPIEPSRRALVVGGRSLARARNGALASAPAHFGTTSLGRNLFR